MHRYNKPTRSGVLHACKYTYTGMRSARIHGQTRVRGGGGRARSYYSVYEGQHGADVYGRTKPTECTATINSRAPCSNPKVLWKIRYLGERGRDAPCPLHATKSPSFRKRREKERKERRRRFSSMICVYTSYIAARKRIIKAPLCLERGYPRGMGIMATLVVGRNKLRVACNDIFSPLTL